MNPEKIIIAIDGHSSCGKSTLAKALARALLYTYIDSGAMYRAVTLHALRNGWTGGGYLDREAIIAGLASLDITFTHDPVTGQNITWMNGRNVEEEIRQLEVSASVSPVSTIREVREAMVRLQREMGRHKGIVMDGRDIGTVVFPDAELKIFMTALPEIRAMRRYLEMKARGDEVSLQEVLENVLERDTIDQGRTESPLRQATGAIVLDNSYMTPLEQLAWALERVYQITGSHENGD